MRDPVCCKSLQMGQNSHTRTYRKPIAISEILFSDFFLLLRARLGLLFVEISEKHAYISNSSFNGRKNFYRAWMFLRLSRRIYWIYREVFLYSYLHHLMKRSGFMRCRYGRTVGRYLRKLGVRAKKMGYRCIPTLLTLNLIL